MSEALGVRASVNHATDLSVRDGRLEMETFRLRNHFAVRFGRGVAEDQALTREGQVRQAFNSPFWPFVLVVDVGRAGGTRLPPVQPRDRPLEPAVTTPSTSSSARAASIATRGTRCAATSRKQYGDRPEVARARRPVGRPPSTWRAADRPAGETEVHPYWVFPLEDGHRIERYVPALPLSRELHAYKRLMRTVGAYRLVIGQPRQEDLLRYLGDDAEKLADLFIDLSPSPTP